MPRKRRMGLDLIPSDLRQQFTLAEHGHACAILAGDLPARSKTFLDCLAEFTQRKSYAVKPGGGRSPVSFVIDGVTATR